MTDDRLGYLAGAWLRDTDEPAPDPRGIVVAAMTRVPQVRQVHASGIRARLERERIPVPGTTRPVIHHVPEGGSSRMISALRFTTAALVLLVAGGLVFAVGNRPTDQGLTTAPATISSSPTASGTPLVADGSPGPTAVASDSATDATNEWGPLAVFSDPDGGPGGDQGLPGTITVGENCVTIQADRAEVPVTLVWADDTVAWRAADRRVVFTDRQGNSVRLHDGDRVMLGGVMLWPPESGSVAPGARWSEGLDDAWVAEPDPSCPEHIWYVGEVTQRSTRTPPAIPQRSPTARDLNQAQQFREDFGFPSSMAIVRESYAHPKDYPDMSRGIPLTPAEAAELDRRRDIVWKSGPARDFARTLDGYAGVYIDQQRGGIPVFRFTGDLEASRAAIAQVMPEGIDFDVQRAEFTSKELRAKQDRITEDMLKTDWLLDGDIQLVSAGANVESNRVLVGLLKQGDMARAREILQERYGPMVDVEYIGPTEED